MRGKARCAPNAQRAATAVAGTVAEVKVRRLGTAVILAAMVMLSGCGRQVTGLNVPGGNALTPAGWTMVRFETNGIFNPGSLTYYIVINTAGNGMPYWLAQNSNFRNWTYAFVVGGTTGATGKPALWQSYFNPNVSSGIQFFQLPYADAAYTFQSNVSVANVPGGFTFSFNRCILNVPPVSSGATPAPTPTGGRCPPFSFSGLGNVWNVNILTADANGTPIDSLGTNGPSDTSVNFTVDISQSTDIAHVKPAGSASVANPQASIYGLEVISTP